VKKISKIYDYYLKLIFKYVRKDIEKYQEKKLIEVKNIDKVRPNPEKKEGNTIFNLEEKTIKKLNDFFSKEDLIITKESLIEALRLFMSIILFREEDKEKKIKLNKNNIVGYLKEQDLWENKNIKIKDEKFIDNLSKIKSLNIKIKEILWLYYYLVDNKDEDFDKDIREKHKKYIENLRKAQKEKGIKRDDDKKELNKENNKSVSNSRSSSKSKSRSSSESASRSSSKSKSRSSSKSNSRSSSKSKSRSSSKSASKNSSKKSSRKSSRKNSRKSSRKSSVESGDNSYNDIEVEDRY